MEAVKKWRHYLLGKHFKLVTDQRSVAFIYDNLQRGKVKNEKIQRWKLELSCFSYDVVYRPGPDNVGADALSRATCSTLTCENELQTLHNNLCHPGVVRMFHFVKARNLPYTIDNVKQITSKCSICSRVKPNFYKPPKVPLIKATQPFERLSIDFKGPLPSRSPNRYLLTIIDEYSRFPFAFACSDMTSKTVIKCLTQLFSIFGMPCFIHSDRGSSFLSEELLSFLQNKGISCSRTTAYNPRGNGQVEKLNDTLWKAIQLALLTKDLPISDWELVLTDALHSIRSLLCTSTNETPHERLFSYTRRSTSGSSLPSWLLEGGRVLLRRNVRTSKYDPLVDEVELIHCNPQYAFIRHRDGREASVALRHLAPAGDNIERSCPGVPGVLEGLPDPERPMEVRAERESTGEAQPAIEPEPITPAQVPIVEPPRLGNRYFRTRPYNLRNREA